MRSDKKFVLRNKIHETLSYECVYVDVMVERVISNNFEL